MSVLDEEVLKRYESAGRILAETREELRRFVKVGMPIIEICEKAEALIREKGAHPAFPCNVSVNEIAAHYTSPLDDEKTIPANSIVKIDLGAHIDGYLTDTAITLCFNPKYESMVRTAEEALKKAIETIHAGMFVSKLGAIIEEAITSRGFKPVSNLTGHLIGRYQVHAGKSLPNVAHLSLSKIKVGEVYAIEPFVTLPSAVGKVRNGKEAHIFRFIKKKSVKSSLAKRLLEYIQKTFYTLPFTERWLKKFTVEESYEKAFKELISSRSVMKYPVFVEVSRKPVAQAEHTVLILEDSCQVLT
jgi:methionyl aminopeptidase